MPPEVFVQNRLSPREVFAAEFTPRTPLIRKAIEYATVAHYGQFRKSGEPYISHPIEVARIIQEEWGIRNETLVASAPLHDVIEDVKGITRETLEAEFGKDIAHLVDSVSQLRSDERILTDEEMLKHLAQEGAIDPRVFLLKLADRLHNMRTLDFLPEKIRRNKAEETLRVYTRVAESLGMWEVKVELEDLSFKHLDPEGYAKIKAEVDSDPRLNPEFILGMQDELTDLLKRRNFHGNVEYRINGYYALAKKREHEARANGASIDSFGNINDLVSFRIRVAHEEDCYALLGPIHIEYKNQIDADRFDEYIVNPRINGYAALQTTLNTEVGPVEVALVTVEKEDFNNWGIVNLMRQGVENLDDYVLKVVFTNTGKAIFLGKDALAIDFAYAVNPSLGADAEYVIADGHRYELGDIIPNSATIQVIPGLPRRAPLIDIPQNASPYTKKMMERQKLLADSDKWEEKGAQIMKEVLSPVGIRYIDDLPNCQKLLFDFGGKNPADLFFKIGTGIINPDRIIEWLANERITKETLGLTTIELEGPDRRGIFMDIAKLVTENNGNVVRSVIKKNGERFTLIIVTEGIDIECQNRLLESVTKDSRFDTKIVV
jgi:GTP diphosphokinase / guanosine-3',5'-bis(diphosphate) 3'-diphosphatase